MSDEPTITINGVEVSVGMAMTIRVALESFDGELSEENGLWQDEHAMSMGLLYRENIRKIRELIFNR